MNQQQKQNKTNNQPLWRSLVPSLLSTLGVALVLGWQGGPITDEPSRSEILTTWVLNIFWGTLAHNLVLMAGLLGNLLPPKKTVKGLLPWMAGGALLTYLGLVFWYQEPGLGKGEYLSGFLSVCLISALMQGLIYPTHAYDRLILLGQLRAAKRAKAQELVLRIEGAELRLEPGLVSCIWVEDHYLHFIHRQGDNWQETVVHGKLKELGAAFAPYLIQVSRSALVNPKWSRGWADDGLEQVGLQTLIKVPQARRDEVAKALEQRRRVTQN